MHCDNTHVVKCDVYNTRLSITHIIIECLTFNEETIKHNVDGNLSGILMSIPFQQKIISFYREIKIFEVVYVVRDSCCCWL